MPEQFSASDPKSVEMLHQHFPIDRPNTPGVFELAIAAAGGTSTGAYVAGVFDFLFEALDCLTQEQPDAAQAVRLHVMTGTSAGGLNTAIAAFAANASFPPFDTDSSNTENPFYRAWVTDITLHDLLATPVHGDDKSIFSVFHSTPKTIAENIFNMQLNQAPSRPWLANPLELRLTVGNLKGVKFAIDFNGTKQPLTMHRDHMAFAVDTSPAGGSNTPHGAPPDSYILQHVPGETLPNNAAWGLFKETAVASAAIPLIFKPITLKPDPSIYTWRTRYYDPNRNPHAVGLEPLLEGSADFIATDGGVFDDAPFELARQRLSGFRGSGPQTGEKAKRAVVLIDPILEPTGSYKSLDADDVLGLLAALFFAPMQQARLSTFDLASIDDEDVYSRFLIAPHRPHPADESAELAPIDSLMSMPMQAMLGFTCEAYRHHDFMLGRRNAWNFLKNELVMPESNAEFGRRDWHVQTDEVLYKKIAHWPIIPLRGTAKNEPPLPNWDWQQLSDDQIDEYSKLAGKRFKEVLPGLLKLVPGVPKPIEWVLEKTGGSLFDDEVGAWFRKMLIDGRNRLDPEALAKGASQLAA